MDTIDTNVLISVAARVANLAEESNLMYVHTVTIQLNGAHGGADIIVTGFTGNDVSTYNEVTLRDVVL